MSILELKFNAGKSSGGSGGGSADLGEVWDALGSVLDNIDALADKLGATSTVKIALEETALEDKV